MPLAELDNLVRIGKLKTEPPAASELAGLLRSGSVRLGDAARDDLNPEKGITIKQTPYAPEV